MERTSRNEQDVIGTHRPVLRIHCRAFDYRQKIALYALARHIGSDTLATLPSDFVDLVEEDDPHRLHALQRVGCDVVLVDQLAELVVAEHSASFSYFHRSPLGAL